MPPGLLYSRREQTVSFTVDDFQDLVRLLGQHPEWRAELRRHVLSDELLELPALMRQLTERVDALAAAQARTYARVDVLTERLNALTARVDTIAEPLATLTAHVDTLAQQMATLIAAQERTELRVASLEDRVGDLTGDVLANRYARRAPAYFSRLAYRIQVLEPGRLADRLDEAIKAGQLTEDDRDTILDLGLVLSGVRRTDETAIYVAIEVSAGTGARDIARVVERAQLLAKVGRPVIPVVAGKRIDPEPEALARAAGVWRVLGGQAIPPDRPASP
jgi:hypothetical protein